MSDGFPSRACADAILFHGEDVGVAGGFLAWPLVSCRGRKRVGVRTRSPLDLRVLWTMKRAEQSIVVPRPDGGRA